MGPVTAASIAKPYFIAAIACSSSANGFLQRSLWKRLRARSVGQAQFAATSSVSAVARHVNCRFISVLLCQTARADVFHEPSNFLYSG